MSNKVLSLFIT